MTRPDKNPITDEQCRQAKTLAKSLGYAITVYLDVGNRIRLERWMGPLSRDILSIPLATFNPDGSGGTL